MDARSTLTIGKVPHIQLAKHSIVLIIIIIIIKKKNKKKIVVLVYFHLPGLDVPASTKQGKIAGREQLPWLLWSEG